MTNETTQPTPEPEELEPAIEQDAPDKDQGDELEKLLPHKRH